jgi:hypothetical protein
MSRALDFRISPLAADEFAPLFRLGGSDLAARGMRRMVADSRPGFPCRVSLEDAALGETVMLLPYRHHPNSGPYESSGPIFVRENAATASLAVNEVPEAVRSRLLSVRAYDSDGMMVASDVIEGVALPDGARRLLEDETVAYLHVHNAKAGCYSCRVDRV